MPSTGGTDGWSQPHLSPCTLPPDCPTLLAAGGWRLGMCPPLPCSGCCGKFSPAAPELTVVRVKTQRGRQHAMEAEPTPLCSLPTPEIPVVVGGLFPPSTPYSLSLCFSMMVARPFRHEQNDSLVSLKCPPQLPVLEFPQEASSPFP